MSATETLNNTLASFNPKELRTCVRDPRIRVGRGTYGAPKIILYTADDRIEIGRYCSIAEEVTFLCGGEHHHEWTSTFPFHWFHGEDPGALATDPACVRYRDGFSKGPIRLGSDVWVGRGATVLSGVQVGDGAVIGACAVVASDVPPFAIVVGNPARCIKKRFDDLMIDRLLEIRWWNWNPDAIHRHQKQLLKESARFIEFFDQLGAEERLALYESDTEADEPLISTEPGRAGTAASTTWKHVAQQVIPPVLYKRLARWHRSS